MVGDFLVGKTLFYIKVILLSCLAVVISACGGGGGGSTSSNEGDDTSGGDKTGLEGTLIFEKVVNKIHQYDLAANKNKSVLDLDGAIGVDKSENLLLVNDDFQTVGSAIDFRVIV